LVGFRRSGAPPTHCPKVVVPSCPGCRRGHIKKISPATQRTSLPVVFWAAVDSEDHAALPGVEREWLSCMKIGASASAETPRAARNCAHSSSRRKSLDQSSNTLGCEQDGPLRSRKSLAFHPSSSFDRGRSSARNHAITEAGVVISCRSRLFLEWVAVPKPFQACRHPIHPSRPGHFFRAKPP